MQEHENELDDQMDDESNHDSLSLEDQALASLREEGDESEDASLAPPIKIDIDLPIKAQIEALLFATARPLKIDELKNLLYEDITIEDIEKIVEELQAEYVERKGGFTLEHVKGLGYQFQSMAEAGPLMERLYASRPRPLSRAALETLAIVAYRQPATRAAVEFIRGVDSGSIIKNLMERDLIKCVGRREDAGRPMIFGTTDEFLRVFGIGNIKDLPPLQAFQPDSDTMKEALKDLEKIETVDVEQFIGDQDTPAPEVSAGLLNTEAGEVQTAESSEA